MYDYDLPSVFSAQIRKARKTHVCYECSMKILKGDKYHIFKGCWDHKWATYKVCIYCEDQRHLLKSDIGELAPFGSLKEWCEESDVSFWLNSPTTYEKEIICSSM